MVYVFIYNIYSLIDVNGVYMSFPIKVIRNAKVELSITYYAQTPALTLLIDDKYVHTFAPASRQSKALNTQPLGFLSTVYNGGTYVVYEDDNGHRLIDYRESTYKGFVHSDDSMMSLQELIGVDTSSISAIDRIKNFRTNGVFMGGAWSAFDLDVKSLDVGGQFQNHLIYGYSPFSPNIVTSLATKRLACLNGMISTSPYVAFETPVIDDWKDNLHVVSAQLVPTITDLLKSRFEGMANERASIYHAMAASTFLTDRLNRMRLDCTDKNDPVYASDAARIRTMIDDLDVADRLQDYYGSSVFNNVNMAKIAESDITSFDVYNILTEASSHTKSATPNDIKIQALASNLVFDRIGAKKNLNTAIPVNVKSDHRRAFFGNND